MLDNSMEICLSLGQFHVELHTKAMMNLYYAKIFFSISGLVRKWKDFHQFLRDLSKDLNSNTEVLFKQLPKHCTL